MDIPKLYQEKNEENPAVLDLPSETYSPVKREQQKLDLSSQVDGDAETVPRKRTRKNGASPAVLDLPSETFSPVEEDEPMEEEDKPERESDGLEDFWNDFSLAMETSKVQIVIHRRMTFVAAAF